MNRLYFVFVFFGCHCLAQQNIHKNAHAHNDYEHARPLQEALENGFVSVEADVHLKNEKLVVAHNIATASAPLLEKLYLKPLDSLIRINNGHVYNNRNELFYLMIDIKTDGVPTFVALKNLLQHYPRLLCMNEPCAVKIFLSGERPADLILKEGYTGLAIDGRPEDVGKGYSSMIVPMISDTYKKWSNWNGKSEPLPNDLQSIVDLAKRIHAEGKKFRLYAIPDNELAWEKLLNAGVDFINSDRLQELNTFLTKKGL